MPEATILERLLKKKKKKGKNSSTEKEKKAKVISHIVKYLQVETETMKSE